MKIAQGEPWNSPLQYEEHLLSTNNVTIRGCTFSGGDDNIAIKNDTANVLIEDCVFGNGHGASIGTYCNIYAIYMDFFYENHTFSGAISALSRHFQ